jgi:cytochrome c oxidase subunit 2
VAVAAVCGTACGQTPEVFDPAGPGAEAIRGHLFLVLGVAAVIFGLVGGSLAVFVLRFRERAGDADVEPPQIYGSRPIEIAWTLAPFLTVFVLALVVIRSVVEIRSAPPSPDRVRVRVVGHQWWWEFEYPDHGFTTANELVIPASDADAARPIELQLESADVIHSFWVPRLAGKTDLIPGRTNWMWIQADHEGTYFGRCAEYCGTQHARMLIRVDAVSPEQFSQWVAAQQQTARNDSAVSQGRTRCMEMACANCHTIRGTRASGKFGPDLTHLISRKTLASSVIENNRDNLTRWIGDPQQVKAGCRMPNMRLSDTDTKSLVDYLLTLE